MSFKAKRRQVIYPKKHQNHEITINVIYHEIVIFPITLFENRIIMKKNNF